MTNTTVVLVAAIGWVLSWFVDWAILTANFTASTGAECRGYGACWALIVEKHRLILFGEYRPPVPDINWLAEAGRRPGNPRRATLEVNSILAMQMVIRSGLGIGALPDYLVTENDGLVRLLPDLKTPNIDRVAREGADDLAGAQVHAEVAAGGAVRADGIADLEVEGPRGEPVRRRRERADRADLHRIAREVRRERLIGEGHHLGVVATLRETDQCIAGDLVCETGAAVAEAATLAVEEDEVGGLLAVAADRGEPVVRGDHLVALGPDERGDRPDHRRVVVDDEDPKRGGSGGRGGHAQWSPGKKRCVRPR